MVASVNPYAPVAAAIRGFQELRVGWNSHNAPEISATAIKAALEVVEMVQRRGLPAPSASPTPLGGVALVWDIGERDIQLLIDDESFDYSVARRDDPRIIEQSSLYEMRDVERGFIEKYLVA